MSLPLCVCVCACVKYNVVKEKPPGNYVFICKFSRLKLLEGGLCYLNYPMCGFLFGKEAMQDSPT